METNINQSTTTLTQFAPLSPEKSEPAGFQLQLSKLFNFGKDVISEAVGASAPNSPTTSHKSTTSVVSHFPVNIGEGRSLPNVLKRISNLLALKTTSLQAYKDTDFKQYWMPDSVSRECYDCEEKFTTFRRRHHCRVCGQIFCAKCCNQEIPGKIMGCTGDLRVCTYCCKVVLSYLQSSDMGADLSADLRALQCDLQSKFGNSTSSLPPATLAQSVESQEPRRKLSLGYQEEQFALARAQGVGYWNPEERCRSLSLHTLHEELSRPDGGITLGSRRLRLRTHRGCLTGAELVDWLVGRASATDRVQARALGQALVEGGYLEPLSEGVFSDSHALYRPAASVKQISTPPTDSDSESSDSVSLPSSESTFYLDLDVGGSTVHLLRNAEPQTEPDTASVNTVLAESKESSPPVAEDVGRLEVSGRLDGEYAQHEAGLCRQLLNAAGLTQAWLEVTQTLARQVVDLVRPSVNGEADGMDIRRYVQVKAVPGGTRAGSRVVAGVVCTKNVAHRGMTTSLTDPRILLLGCAVAYQRVEGRLVTMEPVLMQEHEYLRHVVQRIAALRPDIILVQRSVSRLAQDFFLALGVTLVLHVKESVLERVSRLCHADIATSVDAHIGRPRLGTCRAFHLHTFDTGKTLMFFEDCVFPQQGCTVLLRGANLSELTRVKRVLKLVLFARYNWRLEKAFLMDEFAQPPSPPDDAFFEVTNATCGKSENQKEPAVVKEDTRSIRDPVSDFSDPLHQMDLDGEAPGIEPGTSMSVAEPTVVNRFRKALDDTILTVSPFIKFTVPYLETESGRNCSLRRFFPAEIFPSAQFSDKWPPATSKCNGDCAPATDGMQLFPAHPFTSARLTEPADSDAVQSLLAHYRACGGRLGQSGAPTRSVSVGEEPRETQTVVPAIDVDALDPAQHQKIAVLFCSYSHRSQNAPAFCVNPWVVHMELYGRNDIPLGSFLERYCFRATYSCPSDTCGVSMLHHVRRFAHDAGCIHIAIKKAPPVAQPRPGILMWTCCTRCNTSSPVVPMSSDTWNLSFAKYLELRFHALSYRLRTCTSNLATNQSVASSQDISSNPTSNQVVPTSPTTNQDVTPSASPLPDPAFKQGIACDHSLHRDHAQYFSLPPYVASFTPTPVEAWEISLPPPLIAHRPPSPQRLRARVASDVKRLALQGFEIYSEVLERLCSMNPEPVAVGQLKVQRNQEHAILKSCLEEIQLRLTGQQVDERVEDQMVQMRLHIADAVESWNARLQELQQGQRKARKEDSPEETQQGSRKPRKESPEEGPEILESSESPIESVKTKLKAQLRPASQSFTPIQSPLGPSEHHLSVSGATVPVIVLETELSSIIAHALASVDYRRSLEEARSKKQEPAVPASPQVRRKGSDKDLAGVVDSVEIAEPATKQHQLYIEVAFSDATTSFTCRVYFAEAFATLRQMVLPSGEHGFQRSLARSVEWAARGGKSGSAFCKTLDERFILKEMPRQELQLFLDLAPHYFSHVMRCTVTNSPTLLAKIVGVYRVSFRNAANSAQTKCNLLVMENLFYDRSVTHKFDLKGSVRNRLVNPTEEHAGETVLLDENLLKMTCDSPLYMLPHSKHVLSQAINNDTQFLAAQEVMDYSLLVGLDSVKKELVVGIIDYIRTFTWDKKLETMVKSSGILGGQGKLPTVVSPELYRARFIASMDQYFLPVPDRWQDLTQNIQY